ncbi:MAG: hypothetical protein IIW99_04480 [Treponema sp.]|nr:hypothetical protein [Treponema sp.]
MKLVKLFNKLSAVALAASLVVGFASCSTTTDDPFNPNAPLTLEEYVKSEIKKAIENGGAQAKPEDPSELEFESRTSLMDKIQLNNEKTEDAWGNGTKISSANPLQASEGYGWDKENGQISLPFAYDAGYFGENTHIIIEADDSALNYNADAAIKIEFKVENPSTKHSNEMNITSKFKDGVAIIPISEIGFTDSCQFLLTFRAKGTVTITKIEMAKAKGQSAPEPTPGEEQKPGEPSGSGSLKKPKSLEFHVNANSTSAENTMIFVKYDRSAYGAEEEVKVNDAELNLYINDVKVKTYNEIVFALDEYGAGFDSRGPIEDPKAMKEYKAKLNVGKEVKSGDTVKIELVKASVVKVGAASDKITLANLQFALIDTDPFVDYYKELAPNEEQFQNICTLEDLTTGEDTESKPEPTPEPEPEDSGLLSKAADLDLGTPVRVAGSSFASATDDSSIKITYVSNADNDYHKFKMMCGDGNENELFEGEATGFTIDKTSENENDLHGCDFAAAPSETPAVITYKPSTEEWAKIKAGEFRLIGHGAKITKIELEAAAPGGEEVASFYPSLIDAESADIDGETTLNWGVSLARMKKSTLSGLKAGDKIYFTVAGSDDYKGFRIQNGDWKYNYADKIYNAESNEEKSIDEDGETFYVERATYYFVVTEENITYFSTEEIEFHGEATVKAAVAPVK